MVDRKLEGKVSPTAYLKYPTSVSPSSPSIGPISGPQDDLVSLEQIFNSSSWLLNNEPEPKIGQPDCPVIAEKYGARGRSCFTAFVEERGSRTFGCRFGRCHAFLANSLHEAVQHQRSYHFDHRPFVCTPPGGRLWYVLAILSYPAVHSLPAFVSGVPIYSLFSGSNKRFYTQKDLQDHQKRCL